MNDFEAPGRFDRIVSVEMFEHMRNYRELFCRVSSWLEDDGKFFMHIFTHRTTPYEFIDKGPSDWMSRHFFSGGIMPSAELPRHVPEHLHAEDHTETATMAKAQKAVLVTGASTGIGRRITEDLAGRGIFVYAGARKKAELEALDASENVKSIRRDVTIPIGDETQTLSAGRLLVLDAKVVHDAVALRDSSLLITMSVGR